MVEYDKMSSQQSESCMLSSSFEIEENKEQNWSAQKLDLVELVLL